MNIYDPADALSYKHQPVFGDVSFRSPEKKDRRSTWRCRPRGFARPARCEIAISESPSGLVPKVRLLTAWANSAVQYMAQGYLDQAARVCDTAAKEQPAGHFGAFYRFEDPAAALVGRYVRLRTGAAPSLTSVRDLLLDPIQNFADG